MHHNCCLSIFRRQPFQRKPASSTCESDLGGVFGKNNRHGMRVISTACRCQRCPRSCRLCPRRHGLRPYSLELRDSRRWKGRHHMKARKFHAELMKKRAPEIRRMALPLQKKAHSLGRLIPGCRTVSFPEASRRSR
ncbi:hypothetical protein VIGAN_04144200 [Vigna angularis var. angularis]|uniref:Uncharacterized protein n=1 Tax=Vigna angularis var. angularis TaxID=157739 RepID=A0A0S3RU66_PHAAN|nr:hypothetical protein VIGAN_04144200 [Vigna angularis var. angularis]